MATRTISTRIAVEGESEYKQSIANINSSLGGLKAELSKTKAEFAGNANHMDALRGKIDALSKVQDTLAEKTKLAAVALDNAKQAQAEYAAKMEAARTRVAATESELEKLAGAAGATQQAQAQLAATLERYKKELADAERYHEAAQRGVYGWQKQLNAAERDLIKINTELSNHHRYMDEAKRSTDGCATSINEYGKKVRRASEGAGQSANAVNTLAGALAAAGVGVAIREIAEAIEECVDASVKFESAITGVFKTVEGTPEQLAAVKEGIREMALEIPATTTEIAKVAETAGQLGIATENVLSFSRTMLDLGEATNLAAEEGAKDFARIANITDMAADDYQRLGSVVVDLGNHAATSESEIVSMGTRIAASGDMSEFSVPQIMAYATALSSVGVEAEAGGSGISKLIKRFETMVATGSKDLAKFADVAGMSVKDFSKAWEEDAAAALAAFIFGLGKIDNAGGSAVAALSQLGITEVRMSDAVLRLAGAGDLLTGSIQRAEAAWESNTALTEEANKRYETTESKLAMMSNAMEGVKVSIGDVLSPALGELAEVATDGFSWAAEFIEQNPWLVSAITGVATALTILVGGITAMMVVQKLIPVFKLFNETLSKCPAIAIAAAIAGLVVVIGTMITATDELTKRATEAQRAHQETVATLAEEEENVQSMVAALEHLTNKEVKTASDKAAILELVNKLNEAVPNLSLAYDEQTESLNLTAEAIRRLARAEAERRRQEEDVKYLSDLYTEQQSLADKLAASKDNLLSAEERMAAYDGVEAKTRREEAAIAAANGTLIAAQGEFDRLTKLQELNEAEIAALTGRYDEAAGSADKLGAAAKGVSYEMATFTGVLNEVQDGFEMLAKAQKEMDNTGYLSISTVTTLMEKYPALTKYLEEAEGGYRLTAGALEDYMAAQRAEYEVAHTEALQASIALINQSGRETAAINESTEAIKRKLVALQEEAKAKAANLPASKQSASWTTRQADEWREANKEAEAYGDAIKAIDATVKNLSTFDRASTSLKREGATSSSRESSSRSSAKGEQTQAEKNLEAYKNGVEQLDHLRAMDLLSEEEYYRQKKGLGETYLKENEAERKRLDEELHKWQKSAYGRELSDLKYLRDMGIETEEGYYRQLVELRDQYLTENSDEWRRVNVELNNYIQQCRDEELKAAEAHYKQRLADLESALKDQLAATKEAYNAEVAAVKEAYNVQRDAAKEAYNAKKEEAKAAYEAKKTSIKSELALEKNRLNDIISSIDKEIQARRELREDADQDGKIAQAQKRLEAAQAQLSFARTDEDRDQWSKEVFRLEEALKAALREKEDTAFYREKEEEKAAVKEQISAAEDAANVALNQASAAYETQVKKLEKDYQANLKKIEAEYQQKLADAESAYQKRIAGLQQKYEEQKGQLESRREESIAGGGNSGTGKGGGLAVTGAALAAGTMGAVAGVMGAIVAGAAAAVTNSVRNTTKNSTANLTIHQAGGLTEGQASRMLAKTLDQLDR